jgi:L-cystine transport system permease protein
MTDIFSFQRVFEYFPPILSRLPVTLLITATATVIGLLLGILLAVVRLYRIPVLNQISIVFISFMRGTPIIVQMFVVYYGLPSLLLAAGIDINNWDKMVFVITTYGLNLAAFLAEIFRASIAGVPAGQAEAAYSVGLTRYQAFRRIVAPQAVRSALPSVGVNMVGLLQDTSVAFPLGIIDVMGKVRAIGANTYHFLEGYFVAAILFVVLSYLLEKGFVLLEKKYAY